MAEAVDSRSNQDFILAIKEKYSSVRNNKPNLPPHPRNNDSANPTPIK